MSEETIQFNVVYNVQNIDQSIRQTQRYLYFTNALRLSVADLQQVMSGPTLSNIMWTSVQLTRVWTHLYRIINKTNKAQQASRLGGAVRGISPAQSLLTVGTGGELGITSQKSLWQMLVGYASTTAFTVGAVPVPIGGLVAVALLTAGVVGYDMRRQRQYRDWKQQQREIARSQGLEF